MERILQIWKVHFKHHLFFHVLAVVAVCLAIPFVMGVENLNALQTAKVLELFVSLFGIVLYLPIFIPDQDKSQRELIQSKQEPYLQLLLLRFLLQMIILTLIIGSFLIFLRHAGCEFQFWKYYFGTWASCLALGGVGIFTFAVTDQIAAGYMVPMLYYILCYGAGKKYLGNFYLFSMMTGELKDKYWLVGIAVLLIGLGFFIKGNANARNVLYNT